MDRVVDDGGVASPAWSSIGMRGARSADLRGCRLLIETDNMVARSTGAALHSKAEDMQELLRRLYEACNEHEISLSLTHTPGERLDRPDQLSRGSAPEEPRADQIS